jgi:predicted component of type VI protein secretion system
MIQLKILSGKKAGTELVVRHFPFYVGRSANCQLCLDEPGVWDNHFQINLNSSDAFTLVADQNASVTIEGKTVREAELRNGDVIEIGSAKILFSLSPTTQKSLVAREALTWIGLAALGLVQVSLIYQLLR